MAISEYLVVEIFPILGEITLGVSTGLPTSERKTDCMANNERYSLVLGMASTL